jgi:CheY-like chemotaxis protein
MSSTPVSQRAGHDSVLVVDSHKSGMAARRMILEEQGLVVEGASTAEEALRLMQSRCFQAMVVVHHDARLDARTLIREARRVRPELPILLLCTDADAIGMTAASTGADLVLSKGANEVSQLARGVARLLRPAQRKPPRRQSGAAQARRRRL